MSERTSRFGVYIHIPFCRARCRYCDYVSFERREGDIPAYLRALCRELGMRAPAVPEGVAAIYIGGGTPSLLGAAGIEFLLAACREHFVPARDAEVTLEVNPEGATPELLRAAREHGVNRLSIGVIALNDHVLERLGRLHTARTARESYLVASGAGFGNVSTELLYGLPAQTQDDFAAGVAEAARWRPAHVSLSALTIVPGSEVHREYREETLALLAEEAVGETYAAGAEILEREGYEQYEISSFARPGFASVYNRLCWEFRPFVGFGVGAQSHVGGERFRNTRSLDEYLAILDSGRSTRSLERERRRVTAGELARDALIMGLRQRGGIDIEAYDEAHGTRLLEDRREQIEGLAQAGLVAIEGRHLRLSRKGLKFPSSVFRQFLRVV